MANQTTPFHTGYSIINATFTGSGSSSLACWMEYKVISQSAVNNTSTIRYYIYIANIANSIGYNTWCNNYNADNRGSMTVKVDGTTIYTRTKRGYAASLIPTPSNYTTQYQTAYANYENTRFLTVMTDNADTEAGAYGEYTITHNSNGTKSITLSWEANCNYTNSLGTVTGSANITLPAIDRSAPTVTQQISNVTATGCTLTVLSSSTADRWEYRINGGLWVQFSTQEASSASVMINSLSPNMTYTVQSRARRKHNQLYGTSESTSVTTIGGAVLTNAADVIANMAAPRVQITMTIYNASYTHVLTVSKDGTELFRFTDITGNVGSVTKTFDLTTAQARSIMSAMPSEKEAVLTYSLLSYDDSVLKGTTTLTGNAVITDAAAPTLGGCSCADTNSAVVAVTGSSSVLVQNQSRLRVTIAAATPAYGTSISKYQVTIGDTTVESTSRIIAWGTISESGALTVTATAVDARGYASSITRIITVIAYQPVVLESWQLGRQNNVDADIIGSFAGQKSSIEVGGVEKNSITSATYAYKRSNAADYGTAAAISGVTTTGSTFAYTGTLVQLNQQYSYHLKITVSDAFTSSSVVVYIDKGRPLVAFRSERVGINTNDPQAALDVEGEIRMNGFPVMGVQNSNLGADVDLNDIKTQGLYFARTNQGTIANNYPVADYGILEVFSPSVNMVYQRFTPRSGNAMYYMREYINGTWYPWASNS